MLNSEATSHISVRYQVPGVVGKHGKGVVALAKTRASAEHRRKYGSDYMVGIKDNSIQKSQLTFIY